MLSTGAVALLLLAQELPGLLALRSTVLSSRRHELGDLPHFPWLLSAYEMSQE